MKRGWLLTAMAALAAFAAQGQDSAPTSTLATIAFSSCLQQDRPQPIWDAVVQAHPQLFLLIGDSIYCDTTNIAEKQAAYARFGAQPGYQELLQTCPVWATWDDHDYGINDAGAEYPARVESQKAFLDFFDEPPDSPRRQRAGVYDARVFGPPGRRVQVILLNTRSFRSPPTRRADRPSDEGPYEAGTNRGDTILGPEQWVWFRQQLRMPAELRIIASSIQVVAEEHHWEKWANFPYERRLLFNMISDTEADGVLFISGDRHLAELSMLDGAGRATGAGAVGYPLYDLTSSSLNLPMDGLLAEANRHRIGNAFPGANFGLISIDWDAPDPVITLEIRDEAGAVRLQHQFNLSSLQVGEGEGP
ncbi:MAG: alkaline phosphatase D family protein [Verrucomicrobiota bacterium]